MTPPRARTPWKIIITFILFAFLAWIATSVGHATTVTGTIRQAGVPFTGTVDIGLVYPGTNGAAVLLPGAARKSVFNGQFPAIDLEGNDTILPRGTYYQVTYRDQYAAVIARSNYVITGAAFDIGAAVPTPITPANINYQDLLGIRNLSAQNFSLTKSLTIGAATYGSTGVTGVQRINDIRYASGFAASSSTCGIAEAQADLPAAGGTIYLQAGACSMSATATITKPIALIGVGAGGTTDNTGTAFSSPTSLTANTLSTLIAVTGAGAVGTTLTNFAVQGRTDSTSPLITISGVSSVSLTGILASRTGGDGILVNGNSAQVSFTNVFSIANLGSGLRLSGADQVSINRSGFEFNSSSGLVTDGATGRMAVTNSYFINNNNNGMTIGADDAAAVAIITSSVFTSNLNSGLYIANGTGHVVTGNDMRPGAHQQYGISLQLPGGPDAYTTQVQLTGNYMVGNAVDDFITSATSTYIYFFPQATDRASPAYHEVIGNPAAMHYVFSQVATTEYYFQFDTCTIAQTGNGYSCFGTYDMTSLGIPNTNYSIQCSSRVPLISGSWNINATSYSATSLPYVWTQIMGNGTDGSARGAHMSCHIHLN